MKKHITIERVRECLSYDPLTGVFTWKTGRRQGKPAGYISENGYVMISIDKVRIGAHRLALFYTTGVMPSETVDHRNRCRADNRIENLRYATQGENCQNQSLRSDNKSGYLGVGFHKSVGKYWARIMVNGRRKILGHFDDPKLAHEAYLNAKKELHKFQQLVS